MRAPLSEVFGLGPMERRALGWACAIFLLCDLVLLLPGWAEHGALAVLGSPDLDMGLQFFVWRDYAREALLSGRLPEWNPHLFVGAPFLAAQQSAPFYPINWPLLALPLPLALACERLLHQLIAQVGVYLLARRAGAVPLGAVTAGLVYSLGSAMSYRFFSGGIGALDGMAWAPWVVLGAWLALRGRVGLGVLLGTAASSLQILAGYPQMAQLTWFGLLPWMLALVWAERIPGRAALKRGASFVLAVPLLTTLTSAVALVPAFDLAARSARRGFDPEWVAMLSLHPRNLLTLIAPDLYGARWTSTGFWGEGYPWETTLHLGVCPLLLVALGLRGRRSVAWLVACVWLLLISLGRHNPLFLPLAELVPGGGIFRGPSKHLMPLALFVSVLAGLGLGSVVAVDKTGWRSRLPLVLLVAAGLGALLLGLAQTPPRAWGPWVTDVATSGEHFYRVEPNAELFAETWAGARDGLLTGLLWGGATLAVLASARRLGRQRTVRLLVSLAVVELVLYAGGRIEFFSADRYELPPELVQRLQSDAPQRVALLSGEEINRPMAARLETLSGYEAVLPARTNSFYNAWEGLPLEQQRYARWVARVDGVTRLLGQRLLVVPAGVYPSFARGVDPPLEHQARLAAHDLWLDPAALPRAFLVSEARVVDEREALLTEVVSGGFDPRRAVLLEAPPPPLTLAAGSPATDRLARIAHYAPEEVRVEVATPEPAFLVLADGFDAGWTAWVGQVQVPILPAYGLVRCVRLPAGRCEVVFRYRSPVRLGAALSALGLLLFFGLAMAVRRH